MNPFKIQLIIHQVSVLTFVLIYLVKTVLLLMNNTESLIKFTKLSKIPERVVSVLFLLTGIYLITHIPEINTLLIVKVILVVITIPVAIIGFKKSNKILATLSFLFLVTIYGLAEMSRKPASGGPSVGTKGKEIYAANCTKCHGDDGKLAIMGSSDLSVSALDMNTKKDIVMNGKGATTGFKDVMKESDIDSVVFYIETLKK